MTDYLRLKGRTCCPADVVLSLKSFWLEAHSLKVPCFLSFSFLSFPFLSFFFSVLFLFSSCLFFCLFLCLLFSAMFFFFWSLLSLYFFVFLSFIFFSFLSLLHSWFLPTHRVYRPGENGTLTRQTAWWLKQEAIGLLKQQKVRFKTRGGRQRIQRIGEGMVRNTILENDSQSKVASLQWTDPMESCPISWGKTSTFMRLKEVAPNTACPILGKISSHPKIKVPPNHPF